MMLRIETALTDSMEAFSQKYLLMKNRLLNVEYEHWAAGFAAGNNHGRGHITRVLENLNHLLGPDPLQHLSIYELFLAMMSILYHDIGLLQRRKGHSEISKKLLEGDSNDEYIINTIDKEIIAAAVVSHSSSKDISEECSRFSYEEIIGIHKARPTVIAALVRLADELDEDHRRADPILQKNLNIPEASKFFWLFCQRVRGIRPNIISKRIDLNLALLTQDTMAIGRLTGGKKRHFVAFVAEKLAKINQERVAVNRFLPPELQYTGIHVDVKPLPDHSTWTTPRTFVFNDRTSAEMFLGSFPELLYQPAKKAMVPILENIKDGKLDNALRQINRLYSVSVDLPVEMQMIIAYDKACIYSLKAKRLPKDSKRRNRALDKSVKCLLEWFECGEDGGWDETGRTIDAEVHRMASDKDLSFVCKMRKDLLQETIPIDHWPGYGGGIGSGCLPRGTLVETTLGKRPIESLQPGDSLISLRLAEKVQPIQASIAVIATSRSACCLKINQNWLVTPAQPVRNRTEWVEARSVKPGEWLIDSKGKPVRIKVIETIKDYFEVYDLFIDDPDHNYSANGLLVHNKMRIEDELLEGGMGGVGGAGGAGGGP